MAGSRSPRRALRSVPFRLVPALFVLLATVCAVGARPPVGRATLLSAQSSAPALSGMLAYVSGGDAWLLSGGTTHRLTSTGDVDGVRWTPAGGFLVLTAQGRPTVLRQDGTRTALPDGAWLPDDSAVAVAAADGGIELVSTADGSRVPLLAAAGGARFRPAAWSPDGRQLAVNRRLVDGRGVPLSEDVWLVGRDGNALRQAAAAVATWPTALGWSPDGSWLAVWQGPAESCVSCRADGQALQLIVIDGGRTLDAGVLLRPEWLSWAPDSSSLALALGSGRETYRDKQIAVVDLVAGAVSSIQAPGQSEIQPSWSPDGGMLAFTRAPALPGDDFENLDAAHGYPDAVLGQRSVVLRTAGGGERTLAGAAGWASEAPVWADGSVLFVRWRTDRSAAAPEAQLWQADPASGTAALLAEHIGGATVPVNYYGEFGWSHLFSWHP